MAQGERNLRPHQSKAPLLAYLHRSLQPTRILTQQANRTLLQTAALLIDEDVDEEVPVLSLVNPRRGPTSGGDQIVLIVSNLPPTIKLYARFGSNIVPTVSVMIV